MLLILDGRPSLAGTSTSSRTVTRAGHLHKLSLRHMQQKFRFSEAVITEIFAVTVPVVHYGNDDVVI